MDGRGRANRAPGEHHRGCRRLFVADTRREQFDGGADRRDRRVIALEACPIEQHEALAGLVICRRPFAAAPPAKQLRKPEASAAERLGDAELDDLVAEQRKIGARGQRVVRTALDPHVVVEKRDLDRGRAVEHRRLPRRRRVDRLADDRRRRGPADRFEARAAVEAERERGMPPARRLPRRRDQQPRRGVEHVVERRKIEQVKRRRAMDEIGIGRGAPRVGAVGCAGDAAAGAHEIERHRHPLERHPGDPPSARLARDPHRASRPQRHLPPRQQQPRAHPLGPAAFEPRLGDRLGARRGQRRGQVDAFAPAARPAMARALEPGLIIAQRLVIAQFDFVGHAARAPALERDARAALLAGFRAMKIAVDGQRIGGTFAKDERRAVVAELMRQRGQQRFDRAAHALVLRAIAGQRGAAVGDRLALAELADDPRQRHAPRIGFDLEAQRGDAVAIIGELEVLEHREREPAIGGCSPCPLGRGDQRIDRLRFAARMQPEARLALEVAAAAAQQFAVGPDPADGEDRPRRQSDGERHAIAIGRRPRPSLAAAFARPVLAQVGRPDHRPGDPHRPENLRNLRSVGRSLDIDLGQPRAFAVAGFEYPLVELLPDQRADSPAGRPEHGGPGGAEN